MGTIYALGFIAIAVLCVVGVALGRRFDLFDSSGGSATFTRWVSDEFDPAIGFVADSDVSDDEIDPEFVAELAELGAAVEHEHRTATIAAIQRLAIANVALAGIRTADQDMVTLLQFGDGTELGLVMTAWARARLVDLQDDFPGHIFPERVNLREDTFTLRLRAPGNQATIKLSTKGLTAHSRQGS